MEYLKQKEIVTNLVTSYLSQEGEACGLGDISSTKAFHIIDLGVSMLMTKWKLGPEAGSFVTAFVNNDLMRAIANADSVAMSAFKFFGRLIYNTDFPVELYETLQKNN